MKNRYRIFFAVGVFVFVLMGAFFGGGDRVYARTVTNVQNSILNKAVYQGLYKCYTNGYVVSQIDPLKNYTGLGSLTQGNSGEDYIPLVTGVKSGSVFVSYKYSVADSALSCKQLIEGGSYWVGGYNYSIVTASGHETPKLADANAIKSFVENMGYTVTTIDNNSCYALKYYTDGNTAKEYTTNSVCKNSDGTFRANTYANSDLASFRVESGGQEICLYVRDSAVGDQKKRGSCTNPSGNFTGGSLITVVKNACGNGQKCVSEAGVGHDKVTTTMTFDVGTTEDAVASRASVDLESSKAVLGAASTAALKAINYLDNATDDDKYENYESLKINAIEKRVLYQDYLTSYYNVKVDCTEGQDDAAFDGSLNWFDSGSGAMKQCHYDLSEAKNQYKPVNGTVGGEFRRNSISNLSDFLNEFNNLISSYSDEELADMAELATETTNVDETSAGADSCAGSGAASSLGWIVCPILKWAGNAVSEIYESYLKPLLEVQPQLFSGEGAATKDGWEIFRDIANTVFIVLLLVVIFSQLTGYGIDNYGIKKILPKMIIAAILVNLSYYICIICVDLSNILGNALQEMFANLTVGAGGSEAQAALEAARADSNNSAVSSTALTGVALGALLAGGALMVFTNPASLLTLLVGMIGVLISIFFLFILLAAREAAIVVLVVISPLAFVCYMLPNTKKLFDRWVKLGEGLLLVYPIAGLLIGGGDYVSRLLLATGMAGGGFVTALVAMLVGIIPIFFIPTVLKGAFAAMGNLGAKISGVGRQLGNRATGMARNSEAYKNAQQMGAEHRARWKAGVDKDGKEVKMNALGRMMRGGTRGMGQARSQDFKNRATRAQEARLAGKDGYEAARIAQQKSIDEGALSDKVALVNNETNNGDNEAKLFDLFDEFERKGDENGMKAVARVAGKRKDIAAKFMNGKFVKMENAGLRESVAKEISTGENSATYKAATPLEFHYASKINGGQFGGSYKEWSEGRTEKEDGTKLEGAELAAEQQAATERKKEALRAYVTKSKELTGVKGQELDDIAKFVNGLPEGDDEKMRLQNLARESINNRATNPEWDSTKADKMAAIAGWQYNPATGEFTDPNNRNGNGGGGAGGNGGGDQGRLIIEGAEGEWRRGRDSGEFNLPH